VLRERARAVAYWVWTMDLVLTTLAFLLAWWLRSYVAPQLAPSLFPTELYPLSRYLGLLPLVLAIWTLLLVTRETYTSRRTVALASEVWQVVQVVGAGTLTLAAAGWLLRLDFVSRPFLMIFASLDLALLIAEKLALRLGARHMRKRGFNYRTLLIVGINPRAKEVAQIIADHPHWGLKLLGFVAPNGTGPEEVAGLPVLGRADELPRILQEEVVDEVIFVLSRRQLEEFEESFLLCAELGIRARVARHPPAHLHQHPGGALPDLCQAAPGPRRFGTRDHRPGALLSVHCLGRQTQFPGTGTLLPETLRSQRPSVHPL